MEKLFTKNVKEFEWLLRDRIDELKEAYVTQYGWSTLEEKNFDKAAFVLKSIYKYVKTLPEEYQCTKYALRHIYHIMAMDEFMYLYEHQGYSDEDLQDKRAFLNKIKDKGAIDDLYLAACWLEYYYRANEAKWADPDEVEEIQAIRMKIENYLSAYVYDEFEDPYAMYDEEGNCNKPFPVRLYDYVEQFVIGQPALELLMLSIHRFINLGERDNVTTLLKGPTGCGKNYVMKVLENCPFIPEDVVFLNWDLSKNTPEGFVGSGTKDIVAKLKAKCNARDMDPEKVKVIAFLNEADKIFQTNTDSHDENQNAFVQQQILTMIEGEEVIDGIDMKNWMFVFGGAFQKLDDEEEMRKKNPGIGFGTKVKEERDLIKKIKLRHAIIQDGGVAELMGRISTIITMKKLGEEDIKKILLHPITGIIQKKQREFEDNGFKLVFTEGAVDAIAKECVNENLGARSAINIINEVTDIYQFEMFRNGWKVLIVHEGMITNDEPPKFSKGERRESRWKNSKAS